MATLQADDTDELLYDTGLFLLWLLITKGLPRKKARDHITADRHSLANLNVLLIRAESNVSEAPNYFIRIK